MADTTEIPWAEKTYNPWFGCSPVHTGCENCYAKSWWKRLDVPAGRRKRAAASTLKQPFIWDRQAKKLGTRFRVMLGSLMDFFEDHPDVAKWRQQVFVMIRDTPNLDWIIPTKRPERVAEVWPTGGYDRISESFAWLYLENVCLLASVSDQATCETAAEALLPCSRFVGSVGLSIEPLVGPIDLLRTVADINCANCGWLGFEHNDEEDGGLRKVYRNEKDEDGEWVCPDCDATEEGSMLSYAGPLGMRWNCAGPNFVLDWLVIGGESGHGARVCDLEWIRDLVKQGKQAGLAVFVKQWGDNPQDGGRTVKLLGKKGGDPSEWPEDLRIREYPKALMEED